LEKKITEELGKRHKIVKASLNRGDIKVDITSAQSIEELYRKVKPFDAVVCTAGGAHFGPFETMTEEDFYKGIRNKMMGQINLVRIGKEYINDTGSFTLISGILFRDPIRNGVGLSFINGAINSFVISAAIELMRGIRINVVSPGLVEDSADRLGPAFPGHIPTPMHRVVAAYVKSVEGSVTGQIIEAVG
jgi:NAD(P)-dependent dehydrogenase (short-subunit alcohol dehydrogenase family)